MALRSDVYDGVCVLTLDNEFVGEAADELREVVERIVDESQVVHFVCDADQCHVIDSVALEALLWLKGRCDELFGQFRLARPDDNLRKVLEMTRLQHRLDCCDSLETALKLMR